MDATACGWRDEKSCILPNKVEIFSTFVYIHLSPELRYELYRCYGAFETIA